MKNIILLITLLFISIQSFAQLDGYKLADEARYESYEISEMATYVPSEKEKQLRKRGKNLLISGGVIAAASVGMFFYSERMLPSQNKTQVRNASVLGMIVGGTVMIGATIPLTKANKMKRRNLGYR